MGVVSEVQYRPESLMTYEEFVENFDEIIKLYPNLPNPKHEPKKFAYYLKLYEWGKHIKEQSEEEQNNL